MPQSYSVLIIDQVLVISTTARRFATGIIDTISRLEVGGSAPEAADNRRPGVLRWWERWSRIVWRCCRWPRVLPRLVRACAPSSGRARLASWRNTPRYWQPRRLRRLLRTRRYSRLRDPAAGAQINVFDILVPAWRSKSSARVLPPVARHIPYATTHAAAVSAPTPPCGYCWRCRAAATDTAAAGREGAKATLLRRDGVM